MRSVCPTASISSLQSAHDLDAICVSVIAWRHVTCGPLRIKSFFFFFFCVGGKTELMTVKMISWHLCNLLHLEKLFSSLQTFHSIQYYSPSLASLQRCALTRGIANTIRTQSKWLFTPLHKTHWTIPTSIITSMDLNETKTKNTSIV